MEKKLLRAEEVALLVGCSVPTLNHWYRFKKENPNHEMSKLLPEFVQSDTRQQRYWTEDSVYKLIEFRSKLPHGRAGILGSVTQRYVKKKGSKNAGY